ncbi:hypothetical protein HDU98_004980 [Podochytrium sp. JEL0797]|nr:hypothetical protein HDU98_004980 [Podochytrium sp. JEL0797]
MALLALLQSIQAQQNESTARQIAFESQQTESIARVEVRLEAIETSLANLPNQSHETSLPATSVLSIGSSAPISSLASSCTLPQVQDPPRKDPLCLSDIPREIKIQILSWISPAEVFRFRRVCAGFNAILTSKHFAVLNLSNFPPSDQCYQVKVNVEQDQDDTNEYHLASAFEKIFFLGPPSFQSVFAETRLKPIAVMAWYFDDTVPFRGIPTAIGLCINLFWLDFSEIHLQGRSQSKLNA